MDEEYEMTEEEQAEQELQELLAERFTYLHDRADLKQHVLDDPEFLCLVLCISKRCPFSLKMRKHLAALAEPKPATKHAKFLLFDALDAADVSSDLSVTRVPSAFFFLKGQKYEEPVAGDNVEKLAGVFRNTLIRRNEEMREYDLAKLPKPEEEDEEEEGEEGEEDEDE